MEQTAEETAGHNNVAVSNRTFLMFMIFSFL
jgi:hypothetical protein